MLLRSLSLTMYIFQAATLSLAWPSISARSFRRFSSGDATACSVFRRFWNRSKNNQPLSARLCSPRLVCATSNLLSCCRSLLVSASYCACSVSYCTMSSRSHLSIFQSLNLGPALVNVKLDLGLWLFQSALAPTKVGHLVGHLLDPFMIHWRSAWHVNMYEPLVSMN